MASTESWNSSNTTDDQQLDDFLTYRTSVLIQKIVPPILIIIGTFGNLMIIIVMASGVFGKPCTRFLLTVLAVVDMLCHYLGLLRLWLKFVFDTDVREFSQTGCISHVFLTYLCTHLSSWVLVLITLERFLAVMRPIEAKQVCNVKTASITIAIMLIVFIPYNIVFFLGFGEETRNNKICSHPPKRLRHFYYEIYLWMDLLAYTLIPFVIITACNAVIISRVVVGHRNRRKIQISATSTPTSQRVTSLTVMLLTTSISFLILTMPSSIYFLVIRYWNEADTDSLALEKLVYSVVIMCSYANNGLNFLLFYISGSKFRLAVRQVIACRVVASERGSSASGD